MTTAIHLVDAFAEAPFSGNPAAVAFLDAFPTDARMQAVAGELGWSETAFVVGRGDGDHDLRWFTPSIEVDLCGHATLAAAHLLGGTARFHTRSGLLACSRIDDGLVEMDFPADPVREEDLSPPGLPGVVFSGRGRFDALVVLEDAAPLRHLEVDLAALGALGTRCVILSAPGDRDGVDVVSRVFAPNAGIAEDPVTGSAHCTLAGYWGDRLGRDVLVGEQASSRGGFVRMRRDGGRVHLAGRAVTVARIDLLV